MIFKKKRSPGQQEYKKLDVQITAQNNFKN